MTPCECFTNVVTGTVSALPIAAWDSLRTSVATLIPTAIRGYIVTQPIDVCPSRARAIRVIAWVVLNVAAPCDVSTTRLRRYQQAKVNV